MTAKEQGLPEARELLAAELDAIGFPSMAAEVRYPEGDNTLGVAMVRVVSRALAALASDTGERGVADQLIREMGFDPSRFRTEGGYINSGKLMAAIKHPEMYDGLRLHGRGGCAESDWEDVSTKAGLMQKCRACGHLRFKPPSALRAQPAGGGGGGYSLDADPRGIRAATADAITGALAFGAQGVNPPPAGHWLLPFWKAARADASGWLTVLDLLRTDRNGKKWNCIASRAGSWVDVSPYFEPQPVASPDGADAFAYGASALTQPQPVAQPESGGQGEHVRHLGGGLLALYRGDEQVREIGVTPGWNFRDRDEFIVRYNTHPPAQASGAVTEAEVDDALEVFYGRTDWTRTIGRETMRRTLTAFVAGRTQGAANGR